MTRIIKLSGPDLRNKSEEELRQSIREQLRAEVKTVEGAETQALETNCVATATVEDAKVEIGSVATATLRDPLAKMTADAEAEKDTRDADALAEKMRMTLGDRRSSELVATYPRNFYIYRPHDVSARGFCYGKVARFQSVTTTAEKALRIAAILAEQDGPEVT